MKNKWIFILLLSINLPIKAQINVDYILGSAKEDVNKFLTEYMRPGFEGLMAATNSSWNNSAKPLKLFHVELNISASGAMVPSDKEKFTFNQADYTSLQIESGPNILPTVMGEKSETHMKVVIEDAANNQIKLLDFDAPDGLKHALKLPINLIPAPNIQVSVGLPLGTEAGIRYLPKLESEKGGYIQLLGIGVKHSISQYFSSKKDEDGNKKKRVFNVALQATYQNIDAGYNEPNSDKALKLNLNAVSGNLLFSFDHKFISTYYGIGYTQAFTTFDMLGTYEYTYTIKDNTTGTVIGTETVSVKDPVDLDFDVSGFKATAGVKIKIYVFRFFMDYTYQEYSVFNVGLGFKI